MLSIINIILSIHLDTHVSMSFYNFLHTIQLNKLFLCNSIESFKQGTMKRILSGRCSSEFRYTLDCQLLSIAYQIDRRDPISMFVDHRKLD